MRNWFVGLLLATAATMVQAQDGGDEIDPRMEAKDIAQSEGRLTVPQPRIGGRGGWGDAMGARRGARAQAPLPDSAPVSELPPRQRWTGGDGNFDGMNVAPAPAESADPGGWGGRMRGNWGNADTQARQPWDGNPDRGNWERRRNWVNRGQVTPVPPVPGSAIDSDADGRVDRYYDRNGNGRLDRSWDRNGDGLLDRRFDRDRDGQLDRRFDRDNDGRLDRRFDRDGDGRFDRYGRYYNRWDYGYGGWDRGWRYDRRYDWYGHRKRFRHYYILPRYYHPFGYRYGYRRFGIGIYLDSPFFSSRYWINDPFYYRLPPAPFGARWVRYYNDVLLVDLSSGYVIDVIYNFFW